MKHSQVILYVVQYVKIGVASIELQFVVPLHVSICLFDHSWHVQRVQSAQDSSGPNRVWQYLKAIILTNGFLSSEYHDERFVRTVFDYANFVVSTNASRVQRQCDLEALLFLWIDVIFILGGFVLDKVDCWNVFEGLLFQFLEGIYYFLVLRVGMGINYTEMHISGRQRLINFFVSWNRHQTVPVTEVISFQTLILNFSL